MRQFWTSCKIHAITCFSDKQFSFWLYQYFVVIPLGNNCLITSFIFSQLVCYGPLPAFMCPPRGSSESLLTYVSLAAFIIYLSEIVTFNRVYCGALSIDQLISDFHFNSLFTECSQLPHFTHRCILCMSVSWQL